MSARSYSSDTEPGAEAWVAVNQEMAEIWPNITQKIDAMPEADAKRDEIGKFETYFTKAPGPGN